jgi:hypothetical protein
MNSIKSLHSRLCKLKDKLPPAPISTTPCLIPPTDIHLFTEQEQKALQELEQRVVPLVRTDSDSWIWQYGGPYLALFRISPAMSWPLVEHAIDQELSLHELWFLKRWHRLYFDMAVHGFPSARWEYLRRHFFYTSEELVERFILIDIESHKAYIEKKAHYPFSMQGYANYQQSIYEHIEQNKPFHPYYMLHKIEMWLAFIGGYEPVY